MKFNDIYIGNWKAFGADEVKYFTYLGIGLALLMFAFLVLDFYQRLPEIMSR